MDMSSIAIATLVLLVSFWQMQLSHRQSKHLRHHYGEVSEPFRTAISSATSKQADDYQLDRQRLRRLDILVDACLTLLLTSAGGLALPWQSLDAISNSTLRGTILLIALGATIKLAQLPLSLLHTFWLEQKHGFNRTTLPAWLTDQLKQLALSAAIGLPAIWLFCLLWQAPDINSVLYGWLLLSALNILMLWAYPAVLAPIFFRFTPLDDQRLAASIHSLLSANNITPVPIFIMNGSSRSSHGNAFFGGLGNSRRIVIFDTLLARLTPDEIVAVLAHEVGHQHHGHLRKGLMLAVLNSALFLLLLWQASLQPAISQLAGFSEVQPIPAAMLCLLLMPYLSFPLLPLRNWLSRRAEFQADSFAARIWPARHLITALIKLYRDNASTLHADPLHSVFYDTHPSAPLRINHLESKANESAGNEMRSTAGPAKH